MPSTLTHPAAADPLWSRMLGAPLLLGAGADYDPGCTDMRNEVGITSTPVISLADNKIYVVAKVPGDQHLHALDLATGADADGSPVSVGNMAMTAFDPMIHLNRASLLLLGGVIYIAYGSHCDRGAYHGWLFGYDAKTLQLVRTYNSTPTGTWGAIWQSGVGLSSDGTDVFATVGNGTSSLATADGLNMGNNVVRLTPTDAALTVAAHYQTPIRGDNDLQSGAVLLGDSGQVVGGGKDGSVLLLRASDMTLLQEIRRVRRDQQLRLLERLGRPAGLRLAERLPALRLSGRGRQPHRSRDQRRATAGASVGDVRGLVERRHTRAPVCCGRRCRSPATPGTPPRPARSTPTTPPTCRSRHFGTARWIPPTPSAPSPSTARRRSPTARSIWRRFSGRLLVYGLKP